MPAKKTTKTSDTKKPVEHNKTTTHATAKKSNFEKKLDKLMFTLQNKLTFVKQLMESDFIKTILSSKIVEDTNKWVKTNIEQISKIIGWVVLILSGILLLYILKRIFIALIAGYIGSFLLYLLVFWSSTLLLSLFWFWLIGMKKRVPFLTLSTILVYLSYLILTGLFWGFTVTFIIRTILFYLVFMIYVLKNKASFIK